jgi:hypothetical protein
MPPPPHFLPFNMKGRRHGGSSLSKEPSLQCQAKSSLDGASMRLQYTNTSNIMSSKIKEIKIVKRVG